MAEVTRRERAQLSYSLFLKRIAEANAGDIAEAMGISGSKVSELKTKAMEDCLTLLAHLDLKVVPSDAKCMPAETFAFLTNTHARVVRKAPQLIWEDEK